MRSDRKAYSDPNMSSRPIFRIIMDILPGYIPVRYIRDNAWSPRHDAWYGSWGEQPLSRGLSDVRGAGCSGGVGGSWLCVTSCIARFSRTILLPRSTRSLPLLVW